MKIIAVGDIHGRIIWKDILARESEFDKFVFIGDYFDSQENITANEQIKNFKEIINFKKTYPEKVVLLIGNHDFHYLSVTKERYSGYQEKYKDEIGELLDGALPLLQMCFVINNLLFSHAGVTKTWCKNSGVAITNLQESINQLFIINPYLFEFTSGNEMNMHGDEICQTPIWIRANSLRLDRLDHYVHIVGHTLQNYLKITPDIILIDTLGSTMEYLVFENGSFSSSNLGTYPLM